MTDHNLPWENAPARPILAVDEVHLWRASLDQPDPVIQAFRNTLSRDESDKAARLRSSIEQRRSVASRGILRDILGRYVGVDPRKLMFSYTRNGKPVFKADAGQVTLDFSVTHSNDLAVYAIVADGQVGVDVEYLRPDLDYERIIDHYFGSNEAAALRALPEPEWLNAFFACWTCKEAFIKAIGEGFSYPFNQFSVSVNLNEDPKLVEVNGRSNAISRWSFRRLFPAPGFVATVAVEDSDWHLIYWNYSRLNTFHTGGQTLKG